MITEITKILLEMSISVLPTDTVTDAVIDTTNSIVATSNVESSSQETEKSSEKSSKNAMLACEKALTVIKLLCRSGEDKTSSNSFNIKNLGTYVFFHCFSFFAKCCQFLPIFSLDRYSRLLRIGSKGN